MKKANLKAIISSLLILVILFLAISGTALYFGKTGVVLGIARSSLRSVHAWVALFMCVLVVLHLLLNRRLYLNGLKSLIKGKDNKK